VDDSYQPHAFTNEEAYAISARKSNPVGLVLFRRFWPALIFFAVLGCWAYVPSYFLYVAFRSVRQARPPRLKTLEEIERELTKYSLSVARRVIWQQKQSGRFDGDVRDIGDIINDKEWYRNLTTPKPPKPISPDGLDFFESANLLTSEQLSSMTFAEREQAICELTIRKERETRFGKDVLPFLKSLPIERLSSMNERQRRQAFEDFIVNRQMEEDHSLCERKIAEARQAHA